MRAFWRKASIIGCSNLYSIHRWISHKTRDEVYSIIYTSKDDALHQFEGRAEELRCSDSSLDPLRNVFRVLRMAVILACCQIAGIDKASRRTKDYG